MYTNKIPMGEAIDVAGGFDERQIRVIVDQLRADPTDTSLDNFGPLDVYNFRRAYIQKMIAPDGVQFIIDSINWADFRAGEAHINIATYGERAWRRKPDMFNVGLDGYFVLPESDVTSNVISLGTRMTSMARGGHAFTANGAIFNTKFRNTI